MQSTINKDNKTPIRIRFQLTVGTKSENPLYQLLFLPVNPKIKYFDKRRKFRQDWGKDFCINSPTFCNKFSFIREPFSTN